jgi:purine-nucleoside phosphorylase
MSAAFAHFSEAAKALTPRAAVVLGSGLGGVTADFREHVSIPFGDIPGIVPPTVHGHTGRLAAGVWGGAPVLVFFGRLHFYEGHPPDVVTGPVRVAAELEVKRLVLTNAAGGIHPSLGPGSLMAIRGHIKLIGPGAWRDAVCSWERGPLARSCGRDGRAPRNPYSDHLIRVMQEQEATAGRELLVGVYAALTGPCYETPAEIQALRAMGADAVGMSTAMEAEAAAALGLEVAAVSCVTNKAAGLSDAPLDHAEVLANAKLAVDRLGELVGHVLQMSHATAPR